MTFPQMEGVDVVAWLEVLVEAGHRDDPRLSPARAWLARRRRPDARWPLDRIPGKLWADVGAPGEPNKWMTIRALAVDCPGPVLGSPLPDPADIGGSV